MSKKLAEKIWSTSTNGDNGLQSYFPVYTVRTEHCTACSALYNILSESYSNFMSQAKLTNAAQWVQGLGSFCLGCEVAPAAKMIKSEPLGSSSTVKNYSYSSTLAQKTPRESEAFVLRWDLALVPVMLEVAVGASSDGAQLWEKKLQHQEGKQEHIVLCVVSVEVWPKCFSFSLILLICVSTYNKLFSVLNKKRKAASFSPFFPGITSSHRRCDQWRICLNNIYQLSNLLSSRAWLTQDF